MARECRNLTEWFEGPSEAPNPDAAARGRIAEIIAKAREEEVRDIILDVRTTPSGTSQSKSLFEKAPIIKADHDPGTVCDALFEQIQEVLPETFAGQLRVIARPRNGEAGGGDLGSFARQIRPPPASGMSMAEGGRQAGVIVIREPEAIKPWMDQLSRITGHVERMAGHVATLYGAIQPKPPDTVTQAALQMLPALLQQGRPGVPQGAGAPPGPQLPPPPPMRASWPFDAPGATTAANTSTSVSMISLDAAQPTPQNQPLTYEQVREWGIQNPDLSRRLIMEAMTNASAENS